MTEVLSQIFPEGVAENIVEFIPEQEDVAWETVYGTTTIYRIKHFITYGGGPEGGYVYFFRERASGWYSWHRDWFKEPVYTKLDGQVLAIWWDDGVERAGVVPLDYEPDEDEDITVLDNDHMEYMAREEDTN
jgi:hypothetical protein